MEQAPGTVGGQEQNGIKPDTPLHRRDGRKRCPALFFANAEAGLHFAMSDFKFPALPKPGQDGFDGERKLPMAVDLDGRDEIERWLAVFPTRFSLAYLAMHTFHNDREHGYVWQASAHKRTEYLEFHQDQLAADRNVPFVPGETLVQPFGWMGCFFAITGCQGVALAASTRPGCEPFERPG